jgi:RNA polymerase sigma-70 factor (ECF subfamily)
MIDHDQVLRAQRPFVWRVAYHFLRNKDDAQDVTQDVLLALHERLPSLPPDTNLNAWLYRVTANRAVNFDRDRARRDHRHEEAARLRPAAADPPPPGGLAGALAEAIRQLPPQQRGVVTLRLMEDRPFAEIAEAFGVTQGTVKVQFARGMKRLRDRLSAWR